DDVPLTAAADMLIPQVSGAKARQADVLRRYLGLADGDPGWPTQSDLAREAGVTRQRVSQVLASGRRRWEKQPTVTDVRGWVAEELAATGGLASLDQLADRL